LAKLRILSGREVCLILAQHGYEEIRQRGSHIIMQKKIEDSTITIQSLIIKRSAPVL
jgi:predicted RNA binding protein YcfA (HicA-like mRNA interferase family)